MSECNIAAVATMPLGNLGDVVFDFLGHTYFLNSGKEAFLQISTNHLKKMSTWQVFKEVILFYFKKSSSPFLLRRLWNRGATGKSLIQNVD